MIAQIQEEIRELESLKMNNLVEFHHQLRNLIGRSYEKDLLVLIEILDHFFKDIIRNGIFYIDILNSTLIFFFNQAPKNIDGVVSITRIIEPISDKATIRAINMFIRKLQSRKQKDLVETLFKIKGSIEKRITEIENKVKQLKLYPPKGIMDQWV